MDYAFNIIKYEKDKKEIVELLQQHGAVQGNFISRIATQITNNFTQEKQSIQEEKTSGKSRSFFKKHKKIIMGTSFLGILGLISAGIFAYFHYAPITQ